MARQAIVTIPAEFLAKLIGLPPGVKVRFARTDPWSGNPTIEFGLEGGNLPEVPEGQMTPQLSMTVRYAHDPDGPSGSGAHRMFGSFSHDPANEWPIRGSWR